MNEKKLIGVDIGASGGKMALAGFDGNTLEIKEYRDFVNRPVRMEAAFYWDVFSLYNAILDGMASFRQSHGEIDTIGIDTWGASFGLLDKKGRLLEPIYHYRDMRTENSMAEIEKKISLEKLFNMTGCQCNRTYSLPQLYTYITEDSKYVLDNAETFLFLPDLLCYFLGGEMTCERTIAGTSGFMDKNLSDWSRETFKIFGIPEHIFPKIVNSPDVKGRIGSWVSEFTGMNNTKILATVEHDSAAAVAAIPGFGPNKLYISIGTNISMGIERDEAIVGSAAYSQGFKNTGGIGSSAIVYRDFSACWHINEFIRTKREKGISYDYVTLMEMAEKTPSPKVVVDLEHPDFNDGLGDFSTKVNNYLKITGQRVLETDEEMIRCIFENIALKTRYYADNFKKIGENYESVHVVNGATRNTVLMQMISNALGCSIDAGMQYATADGNVLSQLLSEGEVSSLEQLRDLASQSFVMKTYENRNEALWSELVETYESVIGK